MTKRSWVTLVAVLAFSMGLIACQTTSDSPERATPAASVAPEAKRVETAKPVATETVRLLANNCFTCHGPNGRSPGAIPSLTNLSADEMTTRLKSFKSGTKPSTVMGRHAKAYSDAEIEAVARYIAGLKK